jgi:hypothetical protein
MSMDGAAAFIAIAVLRLFRRATSVGCVLLALSASACSDSGPLGFRNLVSGEPRISDAVWFRTDKVQSVKEDDDDFIPRDCIHGSPPKPYPERPDGKNRLKYVTAVPKIAACVSDMKLVIDRRYEHWIDAFRSWTAGSTSILDTTVVGAGLAGGLAGGLTSQVMNVVSSGLTSTKKTVDQDIFMTNSVQIIITQMKTDRAKWDQVIESRLQATRKPNPPCPPPTGDAKVTGAAFDAAASSKSTVANRASQSSKAQPVTATADNSVSQDIGSNSNAPYCSLADAWNDLEQYSNQGSFSNALATLTSTVSAQASACQAQSFNIRAAAGNSTSAPTVPNATATSPCPPTPAGNQPVAPKNQGTPAKAAGQQHGPVSTRRNTHASQPGHSTSSRAAAEARTA